MKIIIPYVVNLLLLTSVAVAGHPNARNHRDLVKWINQQVRAGSQNVLVSGAFRQKFSKGAAKSTEVMESRIVLANDVLSVQQRRIGAKTWGVVSELKVSRDGLTKTQRGDLRAKLDRMFTKPHVGPKWKAQATGDQKPRIQNRLLKMGVKGKVMGFALGDILTLATGATLVMPTKMGVIGEAAGFQTGRENWPIEFHGKETRGYPRTRNPYLELAETSEPAKALVLAQYPELKDVKVPKFNNESEVWKWLAKQQKKFGSRLPLVQAKLVDVTAKTEPTPSTKVAGSENISKAIKAPKTSTALRTQSTPRPGLIKRWWHRFTQKVGRRPQQPRR